MDSGLPSKPANAFAFASALIAGSNSNGNTTTTTITTTNTSIQLSSLLSSPLHPSKSRLIAASLSVIWYFILLAVCYLGWFQIYRHWLSVPKPSLSGNGAIPPDQIPEITIIRPVKGLEPHLYECLASTFHQNYPSQKLSFFFCVESTRDPAYQTLRQLLHDFPEFNIRIFIESQMSKKDFSLLGPNPKIRNMSVAYREANSDFIWIVDCNAWLARENCGHMIDKLCGWSSGKDHGVKYKFVHNLPLVVAVDGDTTCNCQTQRKNHRPFHSQYGEVLSLASSASQPSRISLPDRLKNAALEHGGGRIEELFFASAHAKMYTAINTVLIAPCIVGKSTMFRKSHLDHLTQPNPTDKRPALRRNGIDYFSDNICEDHLIGDILWRRKVPEEIRKEGRWGKHCLIRGDFAIQPLSHMSIRSFCNRRVRWLRVRKFTVTAATLVEPHTESIIASSHLAFGLTTLLPLYHPAHAALLRSWTCWVAVWSTSMLLWLLTDWLLYNMLHSCRYIPVDEHTPMFARPRKNGHRITRRPFYQWLVAWIGREVLALPIWTWGVLCGSTVVWRDRKFSVGFDTFVHEIDGGEEGSSQGNGR
ncbi:hypothetical protein KEM54_000710 [Ascosphaera aggregata]|nr:hypothetical protein KEM54_000710 [Ascosphaera aggregata]